MHLGYYFVYPWRFGFERGPEMFIQDSHETVWRLYLGPIVLVLYVIR